MTFIATHGHAGNGRGQRSPTYNSWRAMRGRCLYPTHPRYVDYGGRGIRVCDRWTSFANFLADMGERPDGHTLDRINPQDHYYPANCRWATPLQQTWNRRNILGEVDCWDEPPLEPAADLFTPEPRELAAMPF